MRTPWRRMHRLGFALVTLLGCHSPDSTLKPKLPEEYILPPSDDARFSAPIAYPKETLNAEPKKDTSNQPGGPGAAPRSPRFGNAPSGLGGY